MAFGVIVFLWLCSEKSHLHSDTTGLRDSALVLGMALVSQYQSGRQDNTLPLLKALKKEWNNYREAKKKGLFFWSIVPSLATFGQFRHVVKPRHDWHETQILCSHSFQLSSVVHTQLQCVCVCAWVGSWESLSNCNTLSHLSVRHVEPNTSAGCVWCIWVCVCVCHSMVRTQFFYTSATWLVPYLTTG